MIGAAGSMIGSAPDPVATVLKLIDTARSEDTVITADPELTLPVVANATYAVTCFFLATSSSAAPDIDFTILVPALGSGSFRADATTPSGGNTTDAFVAGGEMFSPIGAGVVRHVFISGVAVIGATAGNLALGWAQNSSAAAAVTIQATSWLQLRRLA